MAQVCEGTGQCLPHCFTVGFGACVRGAEPSLADRAADTFAATCPSSHIRRRDSEAMVRLSRRSLAIRLDTPRASLRREGIVWHLPLSRGHADPHLVAN